MLNRQLYTKILSNYPRLNMSLLPTPIQKLEYISREYGKNVYCKRDDLTGLAFGGNKARKLDFLIADAIQKGADTIIAVGANQSNYCRMAAAAGKINGLDVYLVLGGAKPEKPTANLLIDHLIGADIRHVDSSDWDCWVNESAILMEELKRQGRNVYRMPIGGSTPIGALGYVPAVYEILDGFGQMKKNLDVIIHACASGGMQAGYVVGKELSGWHGKIIGIGVAKNKELLEQEVFDLAVQTGKFFGCEIKKQNVMIDDNYMGNAYRHRTRECEAAVKLFAEKEGIILDYVYTGKAAAGLLDYLDRGLLEKYENVLFVHSGGSIEVFEE